MKSFVDFWDKKKVLITGDSGFKGSWLSLYCLKMGAYVHGISDIRETASVLHRDLQLDKWSNYSYKTFDIRDKQMLTSSVVDFSPDVIFHLAAQPLVIEGYKNPVETWEVNLMGSLYLLESAKKLLDKCVVIMITTDKVYRNLDKNQTFVESDLLGGIDPYSASKSCIEIMIDSWRNSYCRHYPNIRIASARSGNVIGGGDYSLNRIVPDAMEALANHQTIKVRNPKSIRPWQHVLDSLQGYLLLASKLYTSNISANCALQRPLHQLESSFNFGPDPQYAYTVEDLIEKILNTWPGTWEKTCVLETYKESRLLTLSISKSYRLLGWQPIWDFATSVEKTTQWYLSVSKGKPIIEACLDDIECFIGESIC